MLPLEPCRELALNVNRNCPSAKMSCAFLFCCTHTVQCPQNAEGKGTFICESQVWGAMTLLPSIPFGPATLSDYRFDIQRRRLLQRFLSASIYSFERCACSNQFTAVSLQATLHWFLVLGITRTPANCGGMFIPEVSLFACLRDSICRIMKVHFEDLMHFFAVSFPGISFKGTLL